MYTYMMTFIQYTYALYWYSKVHLERSLEGAGGTGQFPRDDLLDLIHISLILQLALDTYHDLKMNQLYVLPFLILSTSP